MVSGPYKPSTCFPFHDHHNWTIQEALFFSHVQNRWTTGLCNCLVVSIYVLCPMFNDRHVSDDHDHDCPFFSTRCGATTHEFFDCSVIHPLAITSLYLFHLCLYPSIIIWKPNGNDNNLEISRSTSVFSVFRWSSWSSRSSWSSSKESRERDDEAQPETLPNSCAASVPMVPRTSQASACWGHANNLAAVAEGWSLHWDPQDAYHQAKKHQKNMREKTMKKLGNLNVDHHFTICSELKFMFGVSIFFCTNPFGWNSLVKTMGW